MVEGETLTSSLDDSGSCGLSELESNNCHLWDLEQAGIIRNSGDDNSGLSRVWLHVLNKLRERQWSSVTSRSDQPLDDSFVELGSSPSGEELVELDQKLDIWVVSLWCLSARCASAAATLKINSHGTIS